VADEPGESALDAARDLEDVAAVSADVEALSVLAVPVSLAEEPLPTPLFMGWPSVVLPTELLGPPGIAEQGSGEDSSLQHSASGSAAVEPPSAASPGLLGGAGEESGKVGDPEPEEAVAGADEAQKGSFVDALDAEISREGLEENADASTEVLHEDFLLVDSDEGRDAFAPTAALVEAMSGLEKLSDRLIAAVGSTFGSLVGSPDSGPVTVVGSTADIDAALETATEEDPEAGDEAEPVTVVGSTADIDAALEAAAEEDPEEDPEAGDEAEPVPVVDSTAAIDATLEAAVEEDSEEESAAGDEAEPATVVDSTAAIDATLEAAVEEESAAGDEAEPAPVVDSTAGIDATLEAAAEEGGPDPAESSPPRRGAPGPLDTADQVFLELSEISVSRPLEVRTRVLLDLAAVSAEPTRRKARSVSAPSSAPGESPASMWTIDDSDPDLQEMGPYPSDAGAEDTVAGDVSIERLLVLAEDSPDSATVNLEEPQESAEVVAEGGAIRVALSLGKEAPPGLDTATRGVAVSPVEPFSKSAGTADPRDVAATDLVKLARLKIELGGPGVRIDAMETEDELPQLDVGVANGEDDWLGTAGNMGPFGEDDEGGS